MKFQPEYQEAFSFLFIFFLWKLILKYTWTCKGHETGKTTLKNNNKVEGHGLPDFETYYKAKLIKIVCYCNQDKQICQWNRKEFRNRLKHVYGQLICGKGAKVA